MSQKKTKNKIQASSLQTQPKKDPVSTPIIQKEKEPNRDIIQPWVPYFQDSSNIYPNDLAKRARRSSTHSSIVNQKLTFAVGKSFTFKMKNEQGEYEEVDWSELPEDFKEWYYEVNPEGDDLRDVFADWMQNYIILGNCFPHIVKSGDFTAFYSEDGTTVRKSKDKKTAYVSEFWRDILLADNGTFTEPITTLPFYNGSGTQREYLVHVMRKFPEFSYYGLPDYVGALHWIDIEYRMPKYNIDKFDNGFFPSAAITMYGDPPDGYTADKYTEKVKEHFTGEANNEKFMVQLVDSPEQKIDVYEFDREKDGEFINLDKLSTDAIVAAHRITPSLAGLETQGKLGSNQQLRQEYDKFMNSVIIPDFQEPMLRVLNRLIKKETPWDNIKIGILNVSPVGNSDRIDVNAVTTVNEGREIMGLEPFAEDDPRGELFINNNSVENIAVDPEPNEEG